MYHINKVIGWIASPLGLLFVGMGISLVMRLYAIRRERKAHQSVRSLRVAANCLVGVVVWFMWIMSCGITTRFIGVSLEREWGGDGKPHGDISALPTADAIVVLGGGMGLHPQCGVPEMFGGADRVWQGARLYKAGHAKIVSLSGPDVEKSTVPLLEDLGVPKEAIICFSSARNTEEESKLIITVLGKERNGCKPKILLVTSAWHMRRAKLLFERAGFDVIPAPTDFEMSYSIELPIRVWDFFPSCDALARNSYCVKEWIGNIGYRLLRR